MRRVLVVDDNAEERKILSDMLAGEYEVTEADNADSALFALRKGADAVLLSLAVPESSGFAVLKTLREDSTFGKFPIVAAVLAGDEQGQEKAVSFGVNTLIFKPYNERLVKFWLENTITANAKISYSGSAYTDRLTGLLNREGFLEKADEMIHSASAGVYMLSCLDIDNFKVINDQYGVKNGDTVLKNMANRISSCVESVGGICCRFTSDKFGMLYPAEYKNSELVLNNHQDLLQHDNINQEIRIRIGRYLVDDLSTPISAMYDRAEMAEESIRDRYDKYIAEYNDSMRQNLLNEQKIVNEMREALHSEKFEPWFQPQYNHLTGAMIGAEALVRWKKDGGYISPEKFIPVFERNGFIYEMDRYIWETVCKHLRRWLDEGRDPLPVSVNISRCDLFHSHCVSILDNLVKHYNLPYDLLRLEVTESAFSESSKMIVQRVDELIRLGFTVEIDDFGSGYSSLNTLKDVSASILKLDMNFFDNSANTQRGGNIVESVVRMAKWLGMAIIAEGVEDEAQADYLQSIGCYYIQGYCYEKPMSVERYEELLSRSRKEPRLAKLKTLDTLNNNEFWNPKSMETLIFNSYVGGACIFEFSHGIIEMLRVNDQYGDELGYFKPKSVELSDRITDLYIDSENKDKISAVIRKAIRTKKQASCEYVMSDNQMHTEYIRSTVRVIARADERYLMYCVIVNITENRIAEQKRIEAERRVLESAQQLQVIMSNINGGVSALIVNDDGKSSVVFHNEQYYTLYGYTGEQAEAESFDVMSMIVEEDYQGVIDKIKKLKRDKQPVVINYRCRKRSGEIAYMRSNSSLMHMDDYSEDVIISIISDVTEEKETDEKLMLLTNNIPGGIAKFEVTNSRIKPLYFSDGVFNLIGYTREEFIRRANMSVMFMTLMEDVPLLLNEIDIMLSGNKSMDCNVRIRLKNSDIRWVNVRASISERNNGNAIVNAVFLDITDKKLADEKLLESQRETRLRYERELQLRQELVKDSLISLVINLSTGAIEDFYSKPHQGINTKDMILTDEEHYRKLLENVMPEDREKVSEIIYPERLLAAYKRSETNFCFEFRCKFNSKQYLWIRATVAITKRPDSDDIIAFLYTTDIDTEKKNQLAIENVMNREIESVSILNVKSGLQRVINAKSGSGYVKNKGVFSHDEALMKLIDKAVVEQDREICRTVLTLDNMVKRLDSEGECMLSFNVYGENNVIERKRTLASYLDETHEDIVISDIDITRAFEEEQRQKELLQKAVAAANEANKAKSDFLSRMSHDMRTPLNGVIGMTKLAQEEKNPELLKNYLENIDTSGHFLLGLINDILDISKIESGKIKLKPEPFFADEFRRSIDTIIRPVTDAKHIKLTVSLNCGADCILVDKLRFMQIFFNLLSNAAKFTPDGGHIELEAEHIPERSGKYGIRFFVRDNGIGMSADFMRVMFEAFTQEQTTAGSDKKGTGLGLAIVKRLVEAMDGSISVKSEQGKGTEFTVDLYAAIGTEKEINPVAKREVDLSGLRVLIVEDTEVNAIVAEKLLEKKGGASDIAEDGAQGVERFLSSEEFYYDIILMDIRMPVMDGIEATKKIRALKRADAAIVPIIAMTADAFSDDRQQLDSAGMNERMIKPIEPELFYEMLDRFAAEIRSRAQQSL